MSSHYFISLSHLHCQRINTTFSAHLIFVLHVNIHLMLTISPSINFVCLQLVLQYISREGLMMRTYPKFLFANNKLFTVFILESQFCQILQTSSSSCEHVLLCSLFLTNPFTFHFLWIIFLYAYLSNLTILSLRPVSYLVYFLIYQCLPVCCTQQGFAKPQICQNKQINRIKTIWDQYF